MSRTSLLISIMIATLVTGAVAQVSDSGPVTMQSPMLAAMPPKAGMSVQVENIDLTPVKGAPFCAVITTEHTQPFADGNRIHTSDSSTVSVSGSGTGCTFSASGSPHNGNNQAHKGNNPPT